LEQREEEQKTNFHVANKKTPLQKVGEFIREARQGRSLSVEDLSSSLRIGKEQLIALEQGEEELLPEKVFIKAMVRRIAEKMNLDTSFILEQLNEKKKIEPPNTPLITKGSHKKNKNVNSLFMIFFSGILGLLTSILVLKHIESNSNESIENHTSDIFLSNRN